MNIGLFLVQVVSVAGTVAVAVVVIALLFIVWRRRRDERKRIDEFLDTLTDAQQELFLSYKSNPFYKALRRRGKRLGMG